MKTSLVPSNIMTGLSIVFTLSSVGCSGGGGGSGATGTNEILSSSPSSCTEWVTNSAAHAPEFRAALQPGGMVSASANQLDLSFSGTLPAYTTGNTAPIPTTALFSRNLGLEFTLAFKFKSIDSTNPDLGAFISFQNATTGLRWTMRDLGNGVKERFKTTWLSYGHYSKDTSGSGSFDRKIVISRTNGGWRLIWDYYDSNNIRTGGGTSDGYTGDFQLGFGIQNYSLSGAAATGVIASSIEVLEIITPNNTCNANGFL